MPLSKASPRKPLHRRLIDCRGYEREDGLFDIEGRLTDTKDYGFDTTLRGRLNPGDYIHNMWMRVTLDETFTIIDIEAVSDDHPYKNCHEIVPNYKLLIGERIVSGFTKKTEDAVGREKGCTHHTGLLRDLATVAFQTMGPIISRRMRQRAETKEVEVAIVKVKKADMFRGKRPPMINGCHALKSDNPNVKQFFPKWYTGDDRSSDS